MVPLVMVAMNLIYAVSAYPFGKLSDRMSHSKLLALGMTLPQVLATVTSNPARMLRMEDTIGSLQAGRHRLGEA